MANDHLRAQNLEDADESFRRAMYVNPAEAAHAGALAACLTILHDRRAGRLRAPPYQPDAAAALSNADLLSVASSSMIDAGSRLAQRISFKLRARPQHAA